MLFTFHFVFCVHLVAIHMWNGVHASQSHENIIIQHTNAHIQTHTKKRECSHWNQNVNRNNALNSPTIQIEFRIYSIYVFKLRCFCLSHPYIRVCVYNTAHMKSFQTLNDSLSLFFSISVVCAHSSLLCSLSFYRSLSAALTPTHTIDIHIITEHK